jgi:glycosyltransferase involved in cell wall biosynthesis
MISLCITTYNRTDLLFESFKQVLDDPRVSEIVIVDDCSPDNIFKVVKEFCGRYPKIKLQQNAKNFDCYYNKATTIAGASNEWVIILDSDNIITKAYIDKIENLFNAGLNPKTVYQPSFAKPHFNFTKYESFLIDKHNVGKYMVDDTFGTMLNAMNYFVNRDEYLRVWDGSVDPVTSDSIFQNYNWLNVGNNIYVVPGLEYEHRVHDGSHYQNNIRRTPRGFHQEIENKLKQLK